MSNYVFICLQSIRLQMYYFIYTESKQFVDLMNTGKKKEKN